MNIKEFLSPSDTLVDIRASDKTRLLQELCHRAAATLNLAVERISAEILKREELGSTGTGGGVAVPHARIQGLNRSFGILARLNKPIDFEAIDGRPVDLVFLLLLPANSSGRTAKRPRIGCQEIERSWLFAPSPRCGRYCRSLRRDHRIARGNLYL
jgi:PTS system nitrogen regulatory IIA component